MLLLLFPFSVFSAIHSAHGSVEELIFILLHLLYVRESLEGLLALGSFEFNIHLVETY